MSVRMRLQDVVMRLGDAQTVLEDLYEDEDPDETSHLSISSAVRHIMLAIEDVEDLLYG